MRNKLGLLGAMHGIMALASMHGSDLMNNKGVKVEPSSEGDKVRKKEAYKNVLKSKGVQEFNFNGVKVMARTEAKARKKYEAILLNRKD